MKLSTKVRYGTRAMVQLALAYPGGAVSVRQVAKSQRLSVKYLEHIMGALKAAGLAKSVRGAHGGYALSAAPSRISLNDVVRALEGPFELVECVEHPETCPMRKSCPVRDTWVEVDTAVTRVLDGTTLQDLAARCDPDTAK